MLLDTQCLFSDSQAITASAASTNVVRFGLGDCSYVPLLIQIMEDFATLTSLTVKVQTATDSSFTTPVDLAETTLAVTAASAADSFKVNGNTYKIQGKTATLVKGAKKAKVTIPATVKYQGKKTWVIIHKVNYIQKIIWLPIH